MSNVTSIRITDKKTIALVTAIQKKRGCTTTAGAAQILLYEHPDIRAAAESGVGRRRSADRRRKAVA